VKNTGESAGRKVLLYLSDKVASITPGKVSTKNLKNKFITK
jgi:hypothetical protein